MIEKHPFEDFVPEDSRYLLIGSFTAKSYLQDPGYDWYYTSKRNQFWPILEEVYGLKLPTRESKQKLFSDLHLALTDFISECERKDNNSLDANLIVCKYNYEGINIILSKNKIEKIFFSSKYVEKEFQKHFKGVLEKYKNIELITLPSPSPRYALITKQEKINRYKELLPKL